MRKSTLGLMVGLATTGGSAGALPANDVPMPAKSARATKAEDAHVVAELHHTNKMEIEAGRMAEQKGLSRGVRDFGDVLVRDHQAADEKLLAYAQRTGLDANAFLPDEVSGQRSTSEDDMDRLRKLSGGAFDRQFAQMMETGHARAIDHVRAARDQTADPSLRDLLAGLLPTLQRHREIAQDLVSATRNVSGDLPGADMPIPTR
jgi:putative membrane protein